MPTYAATTPVGSQHGVPVTVWNAENPATGNGGASASQAVALPDTSYDKKRPFSVHCKFAAAPGNFEDDIQVADVDADANYQTIAGGAIAVVDAVNFTYRMEVPQNLARFVRVLTRTQNANAVNKTVTITP